MAKLRFWPFASTALKNLFSRPATTSYPFSPAEYPERMRGHVEIEMEQCISCGLCARSCPPRAIEVDRAAGTWTIHRFDCIQCGNCVNVCPKKCLKIVPHYTKPDTEKKAETFVKPKPLEEEKAAAGSKAGSKPVNDAQKCVYCTLCAKKCPQEAITVDRAGKKWTLDEDKCVGCGVCVASCPKKCLEMK